jgi:hypothetical protein
VFYDSPCTATDCLQFASVLPLGDQQMKSKLQSLMRTSCRSPLKTSALKSASMSRLCLFLKKKCEIRSRCFISFFSSLFSSDYITKMWHLQLHFFLSDTACSTDELQTHTDIQCKQVFVSVDYTCPCRGSSFASVCERLL